MRGTILVSSDSGGIVTGIDGKRYTFEAADWLSDGAPASGTEVDFSVDADSAHEIHSVPVTSAPNASMKGTLSPLVKTYRILGWAFIVIGALLTVTILFSFVGIPLLLFGIALVWLAPKFIGSIERTADTAIDRASNRALRDRRQ